MHPSEMGGEHRLLPYPARTSADSEDPHIELKRPRACEPCRQLKVRCDFDPGNPDGSCKRCAKARRTCIVTAPTRKRQKKTDSRVTELERKIDALTATLQASHRGNLGVDQPPQQASNPPHLPGRRWMRDDAHGPSTKRTHDEYLASQYPRQDSPSAEQLSNPQSASAVWRGSFTGDAAPPKPTNEFVDVIDRGLIDAETAMATFERYVNKMAPEMPMVVFNPGTTMCDVRREKPALFLAIMAIAIGPFNKSVQLALLNELYTLIGQRVVVKGEKSLELVQVLLVCSFWYMPPDNLEELKFYQLIHLAVIVAMDIGLNRRSRGDDKPFARLREILIRKPPGMKTDLNGPEAKRTWVGCYFMAIQSATALRRMYLVRWQPYMNECMQTLETHPDALPSDKSVVWWAKLAYIMEEAGVQLLSDDPESVISFADSKVRYSIKAFSNQLAQWRKDIPDEFYTAPLAHTHHTINLFIHESAMGIDCRESCLSNSPSNAELLNSTMAPLIDALNTCTYSIHQVLDIITMIDVERLNCLPTVALARTTYPIVSLIKIYSLLTTSGTRISQVIDVQDLKTEIYLDKVITHYRKAAALDGGRVASKFGNILAMLRNWFIRKKENGPELREIFGTEVRADQVKSGTTPLHLLSEVAMGNPDGRSSSTAHLSHRSHSVGGQEITYSPSHLNREVGSTTPNPGPSTFGASETPNPLSRMASSKPEAAAASAGWSSTPSFSPSMAGNSGPGFYSSFTTPGPSPGYSGMSSSTGATESGPGRYPDMSSMGLTMSQPMGIMPELEMQPTFDPNNLFELGTMLDEGLFTFPMGFDMSFQM
ncbi:hypothetical protein N7462_000104 [Penicillium macrosclerotiorum]|uniref:uncharacterized protein n=1 Tax=Penicillium macrosclerotiorum TaxID=303699 RepID=UPI002549714D|nr:uncharacterized protein N7462_000104 [Penicillium macrosclerotiorum]KAJ5698099.1 hypothetical protein N7462_000104 [Penicillium macrosclerotiorum]